MTRRMQTLYFDKVKAYFGGDIARTWMWYKSSNSGLGMISPLEAIRLGRMNKLMQLIDRRISEGVTL